MLNDALVALSLGVLSTIHCWGMCGGIVGAISLSVPAGVRNDRRGLVAYAAVYNLGRIASYGIGGALAGAAGHLLTTGLPTDLTFRALQALACAMLIAAGLRLAGWLPQMALLERAALRLWRRIQPLSRGLLPLDSYPKAFGLGLIWGWLPCGLVYSMFMTSAAHGGIARGAIGMLAFGLGTFPGMLAAAYALGRAPSFLQRPRWRRLAGGLVVLLAVGWFAGQLMTPTGGHQHRHAATASGEAPAEPEPSPPSAHHHRSD